MLTSPRIFRKWAGIAAVAGALERKVWVRTFGRILYPNLYIVLVGPPGVGKTMALTETDRLWRKLPEHHVAPSSVSTASLIDALTEAKRQVLRPQETPNYVEFNSLLVASGELGVFLPAYDNAFISTLTSLYDNESYSERRRTKDLNLVIPKPQLNFLAATTPSYLNGMIPEGAWDQGFLSRVIMVYSGENTPRSLFADYSTDAEQFEEVLADLKHIGNLYGKMMFTEQAAHLIDTWQLNGAEPRPEHPKLVNYCTRRTAHLLKLCMVASAQRGFDLTVTEEDFALAMEWLLEAEMYMPDIFRGMGAGGDAKAMEDAWYFVYASYAKKKEPVPEHRLVTFLSERVPSHSVLRVIELMVKSQRLVPIIGPDARTWYQPRAKTEF